MTCWAVVLAPSPVANADVYLCDNVWKTSPCPAANTMVTVKGGISRAGASRLSETVEGQPRDGRTNVTAGEAAPSCTASGTGASLRFSDVRLQIPDQLADQRAIVGKIHNSSTIDQISPIEVLVEGGRDWLRHPVAGLLRAGEDVSFVIELYESADPKFTRLATSRSLQLSLLYSPAARCDRVRVTQILETNGFEKRSRNRDETEQLRRSLRNLETKIEEASRSKPRNPSTDTRYLTRLNRLSSEFTELCQRRTLAMPRAVLTDCEDLQDKLRSAARH